MKQAAFRVLLAALALVMAGCASTSVSTIPYPDVGVFAPTDPARVQILRAEPTRPHVQLGEIMVDAASGASPTAQEIDAALREAAAKLGADAAVIVADSVNAGLPVAARSWLRRTPTSPGPRGLVAVAVKYR